VSTVDAACLVDKEMFAVYSTVWPAGCHRQACN